MLSPKVIQITPNRNLNTPKVTKKYFRKNRNCWFYPPFLPWPLSNADVQGVWGTGGRMIYSPVTLPFFSLRPPIFWDSLHSCSEPFWLTVLFFILTGVCQLNVRLQWDVVCNSVPPNMRDPGREGELKRVPWLKPFVHRRLRGVTGGREGKIEKNYFFLHRARSAD